jgi:hypothetical protein
LNGRFLQRYALLLLVGLTAVAADRTASNMAELQTAVDAAVPGDRIIVQAGTTMPGTLHLRKKTGNGWITIQSSALASLPPAGSRVSPAYAQYMPKIVATMGNTALLAEPGSHNYQVIGLEFASAANTYTYSIVSLGNTETSLDQLPYNLVFDRVYVHGDPAVGSKRGITLNSKSTVIKNSWISDIKSTTQDAQAIMGWNGPGPYQILNNYLEGTGENIMFGGASAYIANVIPSDIEVRNNYLFKPLSWRPGDPSYAGTNWWVKNHFELKNARKVTVEGNILENVWLNQQMGYSVLFTPRTELFAMPWAGVEDVTFTRNIIRHAGSGFDVGGNDDDGSGKGRRFTITNNLIDDISLQRWGGYGRLMTAVGRLDDLLIDHNTIIQTNELVAIVGPVPNARFVYTNNLSPHGVGLIGSGYGIGNPALAYYFPGSVVTKNVMTGGSSGLYPPGNWFPATLNDVGFVNLAAGDYHLGTQSPFRNAGTDGKDVGADINSVLAATAGVTTNAPQSTAVPTVSINPASQTLSAGQTLQFSASITGTGDTRVIWRVEPPVGTISETGLYTAPASVYAATAITVTAHSAADVSQNASASIQLVTSGPQTFTPIRVNVGGRAFTDVYGNAWSMDYNGVSDAATTTSAAISGTMNVVPYLSQRLGGLINFQLPVPNASYTVTLKFAEFTASAGQRPMNIAINGQQVLTNFDVAAAAGGKFIPIDKSFPITVSGGQITIQLTGSVGAILNGIEIVQGPATSPVTPPFTAIRVNAGGDQIIDAAGKTWSTDTGYNSGGSWTADQSVTGGTPPGLYESERFSGGAPLLYQFPVPNGTYVVNLKFSENSFTSAGRRVFNIAINGQTVQSNFDIFAAAGAAFKAIDKSFTATVANGVLSLQFSPVVSNAKIDGIEILQSGTQQPPPPPPPSTTFSPIRVNAGGGAMVDASGTSWSADTGFTGGNTYSTTSAVSGSTAAGLYQTERWSSSTLQYQFAVPAGTYTVNLKFAEIYFGTAGQRIFNIVINGQTVQSNFDPFAAAAGAFRAVDKGYAVDATGGSITIQLVPIVSNPKISAIEILAGSQTTVPPPTTGFTPIRVNAGGNGFVDTAGNAWSADTGSNGGNTYSTSASIAGTTAGVLYQSERWSEGTLQYQFPAPSGSYTVNLKFAEIYFNSAGQRVFNIVINGQTVQSNFDPFAAAGGAFKAIDKSYTVNVTTGSVIIQLVPVISNPKISGIEILGSTTTSSTPTAVRVNAGGSALTDASGNVWTGDTGSNGGSTYSNPTSISGTTTPALYQTERWSSSTLQYQFAVTNGTRTVNLKFAEIYFTAPGNRIFNIVINGQTVASNFDPAAAAGGSFKAVDKSYSVNVTNGTVTIQLVPVVSNPKISAIEIL